MTENRPPSDSGPQSPGFSQHNLVYIAYILFLASLIFGMTWLIGLVIAYVNRSDAPEWLGSHYDFQIHTFWIGLLYLVIIMILSLIYFGFLLIPLWYIWLIVRCVRGMKVLARGEPYPNPRSWLFG
jgi:uncharacterized membrane protein